MLCINIIYYSEIQFIGLATNFVFNSPTTMINDADVNVYFRMSSS